MCIYLKPFPRVYNNSNLCVLCVTLQKWRLKNKHIYIHTYLIGIKNSICLKNYSKICFFSVWFINVVPFNKPFKGMEHVPTNFMSFDKYLFLELINILILDWSI